VTGAPGTLYAGETYQLQVDFPEHYPMEAPQVISKSSLQKIGFNSNLIS
jgi:ubiquitin-protein ligase